ncbi:DUF2303 family protein [Janibacter sp. LM]|uniref:DUF2303 family protein n=1 Tax=Janibacter sp. LM TaxID=3144845 RepID=UPI0031F66C7A
MPDTTENHDLITTAQEAVEPYLVDTGLYIDRDNNIIDLRDELEQQQAHPNRKTGNHTVTDVDSLVSYLTKHGLPQTELWGKADPSHIKAVINAHVDSTTGGGIDGHGMPEWGDHTITLTLAPSKDWTDWIKRDGQLMPQVEFAEFIEDHLPNFVTPSGADMLELAQTFQATTRVDFDTSQRLKSGETQVTYKEHTDAAAGKKGSIAIPDTFDIGLQVYERGTAYKIGARFRYRINGGQLALGYRLTRPRDVLLAAFDDVVTNVQAQTERTVWLT